MNSGGAIAVLSYLHIVEKNDNTQYHNHSLFSSFVIFLVGLACAFVLVGVDYICISNRYFSFNKQREKFLRGRIKFSEIMQFQIQDQAQGNKFKCIKKFLHWMFVYIPGGVSFIAAILGIFVGVWSIWIF